MVYLVPKRLKELKQEYHIQIFFKDFISRYYIEDTEYIEIINRNDEFFKYFIREKDNQKDIQLIKDKKYDDFIHTYPYRPLRYIRHYCKVNEDYVYINLYERYRHITIEPLMHTYSINLNQYKKANLYNIWKSIKTRVYL